MKRLRDELRSALKAHDGKLTYDLISNELPFMTAFMNETLRLYPILPFLDRLVVMPNKEGSYLLDLDNNVSLPHGTPVFISTYSLQRDPRYFEDPNKFNRSDLWARRRTTNTPTYHLVMALEIALENGLP